MKRNDLMKHELSRTLKRLASEKPLTSITIRELTSTCGVSRGTFYNHFLDIYDLINWTFETDVIEPLQAHISSRGQGEWHGITEHCLRVMYGEREFYSQAARITGQNCLQDYMRERNLDSWRLLIERYMGHDLTYDAEELDFIIRYTSNAIANMVIDWAKDGMPIAPERMALMDNVAIHGVYGLIDAANE